jgi:17beta-estradiol 17-dehydrogenase / very-long-chain 3-oxoacyl-CoA reductase
LRGALLHHWIRVHVNFDNSYRRPFSFTSQQRSFKMDQLRDLDIDVDQLAVPATQVFAFIGLLWLSLNIFSFWRLIASLFILPGISV